MRSLLSLAALVAVSATTQAQTQSAATLPFPLEVLSASADAGFVLYGFDDSAHRLLAPRHERGESLRLDGVVLPDGRRLAVQLDPIGAMKSGARAKVFHADGSVSFLEPRSKCYAGFIEGGGTAFFGVAPDSVQGYFTVGEELFLLSSGTGLSGRATLASGSLFDLVPPDAWCGIEEGQVDTREHEGRHDLNEPGDTLRALASTYDVRTADVLIEADHRVRASFPSDQACIDYVNLLISTISQVYRRDLGVLLNIPDGYLRVYNSTPPWGELTTFSSIGGFRNWWRSSANPDRNLPRAAVHALTRPVFGGVAVSAGGLCQNSQAFEISSINASFPSPLQHTSNANWDLVVVSHEFGHTFGSPHTFSYAPPINCFDGSGPDNGTIMSYCHLEPGGTNNIGIRFHERVQDYLIERLGVGGCLVRSTFERGDYNLDGSRDGADLAALDGILAQGFVSRAAEQALDLNSDGNLDAADRQILTSITNGDPAAATVIFNGSGANSTCVATLTPPLLGTNWDVGVFGLGAGITTFLFGSTGTSAGVPLAIGELLIQPGQVFYNHEAPLIGFFATHRIALPFDAALVGATASFQGMTSSASFGTALCNRLDVTLGFYQ